MERVRKRVLIFKNNDSVDLEDIVATRGRWSNSDADGIDLGIYTTNRIIINPP